MLTQRTILSLAQFLERFDPDRARLLCDRYNISLSYEVGFLNVLRNGLEYARTDTPGAVLDLLGEIARTRGDLRASIQPRYRFDERFRELERDLQLDGYSLLEGGLTRTDPSIDDSPPMEDDLTRELKSSCLPRTEEILASINSSTDSFRNDPPDYNSCLNSIRVALQCLATDIAASLFPDDSAEYDPTKWGAVISHLKKRELLSPEEERGLAGVFGFVSPGCHRPIDLSEDEMARLGRQLALNMCWFLVKRFKRFKDPK